MKLFFCVSDVHRDDFIIKIYISASTRNRYKYLLVHIKIITITDNTTYYQFEHIKRVVNWIRLISNRRECRHWISCETPNKNLGFPITFICYDVKVMSIIYYYNGPVRVKFVTTYFEDTNQQSVCEKTIIDCMYLFRSL